MIDVTNETQILEPVLVTDTVPADINAIYAALERATSHNSKYRHSGRRGQIDNPYDLPLHDESVELFCMGQSWPCVIIGHDMEAGIIHFRPHSRDEDLDDTYKEMVLETSYAHVGLAPWQNPDNGKRLYLTRSFFRTRR